MQWGNCPPLSSTKDCQIFNRFLSPLMLKVALLGFLLLYPYEQEVNKKQDPSKMSSINRATNLWRLQVSETLLQRQVAVWNLSIQRHSPQVSNRIEGESPFFSLLSLCYYRSESFWGWYIMGKNLSLQKMLESPLPHLATLHSEKVVLWWRGGLVWVEG